MSNILASSWSTYRTQFGNGIIVMVGNRITRVLLPIKSDQRLEEEREKLGIQTPEASTRSKVGQFARHLELVFLGKADPCDLLPEIEWPKRRNFSDRVQRQCAQIPCGKIAPYSELAAKAGSAKAARAVGQVMRTNPIPLIIPCHRVDHSTGNATKYGGGPDMKRWLQEKEREFATK